MTNTCKGMCKSRKEKVKETFLLFGTDKCPSSGFVTLFALFENFWGHESSSPVPYQKKKKRKIPRENGHYHNLGEFVAKRLAEVYLHNNSNQYQSPPRAGCQLLVNMSLLWQISSSVKKCSVCNHGLSGLAPGQHILQRASQGKKHIFSRVTSQASEVSGVGLSSFWALEHHGPKTWLWIAIFLSSFEFMLLIFKVFSFHSYCFWESFLAARENFLHQL